MSWLVSALVVNPQRDAARGGGADIFIRDRIRQNQDALWPNCNKLVVLVYSSLGNSSRMGVITHPRLLFVPSVMLHGFGVNAFQSNVPSHLVQLRLGNASLRTRSIYGDVIRPEERTIAARMWGI
jgi:hypothetical protein